MEIALDPAKDSVTGKEIRIEPALVCPLRAVITAEENNSAVVYIKFFEQRQNPSNIPIHPSEHRGIILFLRAPGLGRVRRIVRYLHAISSRSSQLVIRVRNCIGQVEKETPLAISANKLERFSREQVMRVCPFIERYALLIATKIVRIIIMGVVLIQVTEELVKPFAVRDAACFRFTQPPFPDKSRSISGSLEHFRYCHVLRTQRQSPRGLSALAGHGHQGRIPSNVRMALMEPGDQAAARRSAHWTPGIKVRKTDTLSRHPVQVRRLDHLLSVAAQIAVAKIISENHYYVRPAPCNISEVPGRAYCARRETE